MQQAKHLAVLGLLALLQSPLGWSQTLDGQREFIVNNDTDVDPTQLDCIDGLRVKCRKTGAFSRANALNRTWLCDSDDSLHYKLDSWDANAAHEVSWECNLDKNAGHMRSSQTVTVTGAASMCENNQPLSHTSTCEYWCKRAGPGPDLVSC